MSYGPTSPSLGPWAALALRGSWRGLPFVCEEDSLKPGRRTVLHEYPDRPTPWVEDLGLATPVFTIKGYLTGDTLGIQRVLWRAAFDQPGVGLFIHPWYGPMSGKVIAPILTTTLTGNKIEVGFTFIASPLAALFPSSSIWGQAAAIAASVAAFVTMAAEYVFIATSAISLGIAVVQAGIAVMVGFTAIVVGTAGALDFLDGAGVTLPGPLLTPVLTAAGRVAGVLCDPGIFSGAVLGLVPPAGAYYGRYATAGLTAMLPATATADSQLSGNVAAWSVAVVAAEAAFVVAATAPLTLAAAIQAMIAALLAAVPGPADELRLLETIAAYQPVVTPSAAPVGGAMAAMQVAMGAMIRRCALCALAVAEAAYQPTSYDDAVLLRDTLTALFDAEILFAGDNGDTNSFTALRALRAAIVLDLVTRGSRLPRLAKITEATALPSLAVAWQLYGDASRSDDLIARVDPPHPGFMPLTFDALTS